MPMTTKKVTNKLESIGVTTTAELAKTVTVGTISQQLQAAGESAFLQRTIAAFKQVFQIAED